MANKVLMYDGLNHLVTALKDMFVRKDGDKVLSEKNFSAADKTKLDSLQNYTLPDATKEVKGGVIVGDRLTIAEGKLSADKAKWADIQGVPTDFQPKKHDHEAADITDLTTAVDSEITSKLTEGKYQKDTDVKNTLTTGEYQTKANVEALIAGKGYQTSEQVQAAIAGSSHITRKVVEQLPEADGANENTVYMVKKDSEGEDQNVYDEYLYIADTQKFEHIGASDVDLSGYMKKEEMTAITTGEIDSILADE